MSEEEAKQNNSGNQNGKTGEDRKPARKKGTKKVVSRVRDAKSDSADREPKAAPVGDDHSETAKQDSAKEPEIKTVVEKAPEKDRRSGDSRDDRRKPGRGRRSSKGSSGGTRSSEPVDPEELAKRAWKIFQSDVAEEGIALVDNNTGRQLALRSFELARVFLEEKNRQMRSHSSPSGSSKDDQPNEDQEKSDDS